MVKLTIVGRVKDGLPLAQGHRYVTDDHGYFGFYKQQAELVLEEIARGALKSAKMTIHVNHHCFHYLVEDGVCFIVLCESSYPRKLAFHYLQDLHTEFDKFDKRILDKITRPYSFVKFDGVIGNIRKRYIDTRTQANLSKLNAHRKKDVDIVTMHVSEIARIRARSLEILESRIAMNAPVSPIWGSSRMEAIVMTWTPIALIVSVATIVIWASVNLTESFVV
ncbi:25.3 kDa vesicle transport protein isoform X2 [Rhodamnia argentea]|uniref:25.3 kDa vesicle transport protein isoform X2 n=1 Tax=Rhodamnia argentea TaxID=178133 RepID=A0A8B8PFE2_9MYRT|nr:25.3 kDa vesicle transport protein isoform X2 [Rhodamnia argentea]